MSSTSLHPFLAKTLFLSPTMKGARSLNKQQQSPSAGFLVTENEKKIELSVDLPGVRAKDLVVKIEDGVLHIAGTRRVSSHGGDTFKKYRFARTFSIDKSVDTSLVKANLADGVLVLTAPKKSKPLPLIIPVTENHEESVVDSKNEAPMLATVADDATSDSDGKESSSDDATVKR